MDSKYSIAKKEILELYKDYTSNPNTIIKSESHIARKVKDKFKFTENVESIRYYVRTVLKEHKATSLNSISSTISNDYSPQKFTLSAWHKEGYMMDIDQYCEYYKLPRKDISSYKLVSHTGTPFYNIVFKDKNIESSLDIQKVKSLLEKEITKVYRYTQKDFKKDKTGVGKWADLHLGALIKGLLKTPSYNTDILIKKLHRSVNEINSHGFKKVHIHIHGDLIESFSGLNHINSWMSMDSEIIGAKAVKLCVKILHEALSKVNNLGEVKIVAGNHDRTSKANDEDVKGGAAELIAWGLELMGYDVEFHSYVLTQEVDGIFYIIFHGDKQISKKSSEEIILKYGKQHKYNVICEAHLHTFKQKSSRKEQNFVDEVKIDSLDYRRVTCPSMFPGNYYSETLGYTSNTGFLLFWENGFGKPNQLVCSLE
ncbi:hypothetical protein [Tenacibaculum sp. 190524A05c]|uniref:hypothetical protein n=1 Tax=Tenacibaculum platacis TaxID=3137852 RepID=UPI0031FB3E3D